jgi:hypothetical protein
MARLGQKALHQIQGQPQTSRVPPRQQNEPPKQVSGASELETIHDPPDHDSVPAKRQRTNGHGIVSPPDMPLDTLPAPLNLDIQDGFADIDTLFGEFLDISLPTNFWDPIFMEEQNSQS